MLPLAGPDFPTSIEQLSVALRAGLADRGLTPHAVRADGAWPNVLELSIDLTGAKASRATRLPSSGESQAANLSAERLIISATPMYFEATPIRFDMRVENAQFGFARSQTSESLLQLTAASIGTVTIEAKRDDLESLLKQLAADAAEKQGAQVKSARLEFTSRGPRSLDFRAEITAKVFLMTAHLAITGKADVDGELNLRLSDLACTGDGMIANMAAGFLRPRLNELQRNVIPLATFSLAGLKAHDVQLIAGDTLRLEARFAS